MSVDFLPTHKEPRTAQTAGAWHRRSQLPCTTDPYTQPPTLDELMRDLRHLDARAADDLADWLVYLEVDNKAPKTLYVYARQIAKLLRAHPDLRFDEFTHKHVIDVLAYVPRQSRHITRSIINGWFDWGVIDERLERSPMNKVPKTRAMKTRPSDIFTEAEVAALEALPIPDGPLWAILFGSGIRRSEARHLQRKHIDLNRGRLIVIQGKGGKDSVVPLPPAVLAAVADLDLVERLSPNDYLWYTRAGRARRRRDPISSTSFARGWGDLRPGWYERGILDAAVRYLNPHQTRHTYGHWLRDQGLDPEERQLLMRHESVRTTIDQYGHVTIEDVARKVAAL